MLEARYAAGRSSLFMLGGLACMGLDAGLYLFATFHYPALWLVGGALALLGLRVVDRRVKLRIDPEGLFCAAWTPRTIPWAEFEWFRVFEDQGFPFIEAQFKYPDQFQERLSGLSRFNSWCAKQLGKPPFYINPTQLDVGVDDVVAALEANGATV